MDAERGSGPLLVEDAVEASLDLRTVLRRGSRRNRMGESSCSPTADGGAHWSSYETRINLTAS